jgi:UDP-N-acetylenolpyruvoylglucosamine reductase
MIRKEFSMDMTVQELSLYIAQCIHLQEELDAELITIVKAGADWHDHCVRAVESAVAALETAQEGGE